MESQEGRLSSERSAKMKRRRSASASPRRTSRGSSGNKRGGSASKKSTATRQQKNKRRSSMRRRSLIATLESIHSEESAKTEANNVENPDSRSSAEQIGQTGDPISAIATVTALLKGDKFLLDSGQTAPLKGDKFLLDSGVPSSQDFHFKSVPKLRAECNAWTEELNRYKGSQDGTPEFGISTNLNTEEINAKYEFWHEQISVLEDKLSASLTVVSKAMQRIDELKTLHTVRVSKATEDIFNSALEESGGGDSKLLIKKIFMLHSMIEDR